MYGLPEFELVTNHEALKVVYSTRSKPSARIERCILRLQPYNYGVCYVTSRENIADALSRLTKIEDSFRFQDDDEYVHMVASHANTSGLKDLGS